MEMRVIYYICLIILAIINLSVQKVRIIGDCSNYNDTIATLKDNCLRIDCRNDTIKVKSCCLSDKPCPDDGALQLRHKPKNKKFPACCPYEECIF